MSTVRAGGARAMLCWLLGCRFSPPQPNAAGRPRPSPPASTLTAHDGGATWRTAGGPAGALGPSIIITAPLSPHQTISSTHPGASTSPCPACPWRPWAAPSWSLHWRPPTWGCVRGESDAACCVALPPTPVHATLSNAVQCITIHYNPYHVQSGALGNVHLDLPAAARLR